MKFKTHYASLVFALLLLSFPVRIHAQDLVNYDWEEDRAFEIDTVENAPLLLLKSHIQYDYSYENNELICYYTLHKIFKVNNDDAVQSVNRIYIPLNNTLDIITVKARTLTADGRKVELDQNNIKEVKDPEAGAGYKIFAIEGAEVNSEIEYLYTKKVSASLFVREYMQFKFPIKQTTFKVTSPKNLKYDFRSYNGLLQPTMNEEINERNVTTLEMGEIPALPEEAFSSYNASRMRIEFKLAMNTVSGNKRLFTWADGGKRIFSLLYPFSNSETKAMDKFLKKIDVKNFADDREKVAYAENYIKSKFYLDDDASGEAENVDQIIDHQFSTNRGMTRLFIALLNALEVKHEVVLTSSRNDFRFDASFDTWNYLSEYLIYLTDYDVFLAPYNFQFRLGLFPPEYAESDGLFIRNISFEGVDTQASRIKNIPAPSYTENFDNLDIKVSFNEDLTENKVFVKRSHKGYTGSYYKTAYQRADEKVKTEILEEVVNYLAPDADIKDIKLDVESFEHNNWAEPFIVTSNFTSANYIEMAGNVILFKAGMLIGTQSELYQEKKRMNEIENVYNRGYKRIIEVEIPKGYEIQNIQDLDMNVEAKGNKNQVVYKFHSTHEIKGQMLTINIDEYYDQIFYPKEKFEDFRKVINAAADWNKVTLVLQQK